MKRSPKLSKGQIVELSNIIKSTESAGLEISRAQAVMLINDEVRGESLGRLTGYNEKHAYRLRNLYLRHGLKAIEDNRKPKPKELLTVRQREEILEVLKSKTPNECDSYYNADYWDTGVLAAYIFRKYKVRYKSKTSYYIVFRRAKFSYHKPGRVYEKRDEARVRQWQNDTRPILKKAYSEPDTVVLAEDEMVLSTQTTFQKIWLPKGEYPKIEVSNTKKNRSVYGFLNIKTGREHAFKTEWQNMYITCDILKQIRSIYPTQKILLLWDGAGWHRGSKAQEFLKEDNNIQVHYFPTYSPEENPQEHVWKEGRSQVTHNRFLKDIDEATDDFVAYLNNTSFPYKLIGFGGARNLVTHKETTSRPLKLCLKARVRLAISMWITKFQSGLDKL